MTSSETFKTGQSITQNTKEAEPSGVQLDLELAELERHSVTISGHRTSISLEKGFWQELKKLAAKEGVPLAQLIRRLDEERSGSLSGALRSYVLQNLLG